MAGRGNKVNLDYFELDCRMDEKVRLLQAEFGLKGFAVFVKLLQEIYGENGYYCEWTQDRELLFASENGLNSGSLQLLRDIVSACIRRNIFSERLFKEYGILTSQGIQKQYLKATVKREAVDLKKEYLLISIPENRSNVVINSISGGRNSISGGRNSKSRVEKSRVEKNKREITRAEICLFEKFWLSYPKECNRHLAEVAYCDLILEDMATEEELVACAKNYAETCKIDKTPEKYIKSAHNFLKDFSFEKYLPEKYEKPKREAPKSRNKFHNFDEVGYDYDAIVKELNE